MNKKYYEPIKCGDTIPLNNPHGFSVSMPTIRDVIEYEEGSDESKKTIKSAYPRIVIHPYIKRACELIKTELDISDEYIFLLPSLEIANRVVELSLTNPTIRQFKSYGIASFKEGELAESENYYSFMKHCGFMIFSREAEDLLISLGENIDRYRESYFDGESQSCIKEVLEEGYGKGLISISGSGMNSIYSGFNLIKEESLKKGREVFILFGWAYSDTLAIFRKCTKESVFIPNVFSMDKLEEVLEERGEDIAAIYVESVSNPLIAVPDIPRLYEFSKKYGFYLMIDNTFATPWNVSISKYSDIIFDSLTKFPSGMGDVMAGAIIIPDYSRIENNSKNMIYKYSVPLYERDCRRLALNIKDYKERVIEMGKNSLVIENKIKLSSKFSKVYSVNSKENIENWRKIAVDEESTCPVISFIPSGDLEEFYNNLNLPKGPSLGTEFPLVMPYTLLAHWEETKSKEGLSFLKSIGLDPNLLRLSVGRDDPSFTLSQLLK